MPVKKLMEEFLLCLKNPVKQDLNIWFTRFSKWFLISLLIGIIVGSASALFLTTLNWASAYRENHLWIIYFLPVAGLSIGMLYNYWGKDVVKGNNLLIEELQTPKKSVPLIMAPLIYITTIVTHLFGGSAGREGTAVQIGGSIADQFTTYFKLNPRERKILLICGISAGFSSVFGTPIAGTIFGLEVFMLGSLMYGAIMPALITAIIADYACRAWGVDHTHYFIYLVPGLSLFNIVVTLAAGMIFGLAARSFSLLNHFLSGLFSKIKYPPFKPLAGGMILLIVIHLIGNTRYIGLGIPVISEAFIQQEPYDAFIIKLLLTALTLASGFKGGEVTPLFFIGATLGSFLSIFMPLPVGLLAGMGFVAVFSGAANTPLACIFMGLELFGLAPGIYIALACATAYMFSGYNGIYSSQTINVSKRWKLKKHQFLG